MNSDDFERELWIIGSWRKLAVSDVWAYFEHACLLNGALVSFRSPDITRLSINTSKIEEVLDGAYVPSFEISGEDFSFRYAQNAGQNYDHLIIKSCSNILSVEFCDELITKTVASDPAFIQAHLVDNNYQRLQNIFDPLQFRALGLSMVGLPMKSNGLPFPLEQQIVDTDYNPGRYRLHQGYVEASAAYMWFGEKFWSIIDKNPEDTKVALPEGVSLCFEKCWHLRFAEGVFADENTTEIQNGIRRAIFGKS